MFRAFVAGFRTGILAGVFFALGFSWRSLAEDDSVSMLFTTRFWIIPVAYGSIFAVGHAFVAASSVAVTLSVMTRLVPLPGLIHAITSLLVLYGAYHLWVNSITVYHTMIELGSFKSCCFFSAGFVTQVAHWNSRR